MDGMDLSVRASVTALLFEGGTGYVRTYPTDGRPSFKPLVPEAKDLAAPAPHSSPPDSDGASPPLQFSDLFEPL